MFSQIKILFALKSLASKFLAIWKVTEGKKTISGLLSLAVWMILYIAPIYFPSATWLQTVADTIISGAQVLSIHLDKTLLEAGAGLTVVGFADKIRQIFLPIEKN